jgi:hypothetical protein
LLAGAHAGVIAQCYDVGQAVLGHDFNVIRMVPLGQPGLQIANEMTERRPGNAQLRRRSGEAPLARDGQEGDQQYRKLISGNTASP